MSVQIEDQGMAPWVRTVGLYPFWDDHCPNRGQKIAHTIALANLVGSGMILWATWFAVAGILLRVGIFALGPIVWLLAVIVIETWFGVSYFVWSLIDEDLFKKNMVD